MSQGTENPSYVTRQYVHFHGVSACVAWTHAGVKPDETEYCIQPECALSLDDESYSWSFSGFGPCSKSCAGGRSHRIAPAFPRVQVSDDKLARRHCN